jgi:plastocyanin
LDKLELSTNKAMKLPNLISRLFFTASSTTLLLGISYSLTANPVMSETITVKMGGSKGLVFEPAVVTVKPGDTIHFVVGNLPPHNVVFDTKNKALDAQLSHKALANSGSFDVIIPANQPASTLTYFCLPHRGAGMVGKVVVVR